MAAPPHIHLAISNRAENVVLVREMLTGLAETIGIDAVDMNDIRTAVTEACNNVVMHAYEGEEGPLEVEVYLATDTVEVLVRDQGVGIQAQQSGSEDPASVGIGLPVIRALVHRVEFRDTGGSGTEVWMDFATPGTGSPEVPAFSEGEPPVARREARNTTVVTISSAPLAAHVLPRLLSVLAARAYFSTDRISDTLLLADELVAQAPPSSGAGRLSVTVSVEPRNLELQVGPLEADRGQSLGSEWAAEGAGSLIERLADRHRVEHAGAHVVLNVQLSDQR